MSGFSPFSVLPPILRLKCSKEHPFRRQASSLWQLIITINFGFVSGSVGYILLTVGGNTPSLCQVIDLSSFASASGAAASVQLLLLAIQNHPGHSIDTILSLAVGAVAWMQLFVVCHMSSLCKVNQYQLCPPVGVIVLGHDCSSSCVVIIANHSSSSLTNRWSLPSQRCSFWSLRTFSCQAFPPGRLISVADTYAIDLCTFS